MIQAHLLPTTYQQKLLWHIVKNKPELPFANLNIHIKFDGSIEPQTLLNAFKNLIMEQDGLRTSFHEIEGVLWRLIHTEPMIDLEFTDIRGTTPEHQNKFMQAFIEKTFSNPMPMDLPLAVRGRLFQLGDEDFRLIATLNHMVTDGLSIVSLFFRLAQLYQQTNLPAPPSNFETFAEEQNHFLKSPRELRQMNFWRQYLAGYDPTDSFSLQSAPDKLYLYHTLLPSETMRKLAASSEGTLSHAHFIMQSAYMVLLAKAFELKDIGIFSILANRSREYRSTIGYLANIVIYRTMLNDDPSLQDVLALTESSLHQVARNAKLPYLKVWREIFHEDYDRIPRFFFNLIPQPDKPLPFGSATVQAVPGLSDWIYWNGQEHYTLGLTIYMTMPNSAGLEWRYDSRLFKKETVQAWSDFYLRIVNDLLDSKNSKLSELVFP